MGLGVAIIFALIGGVIGIIWGFNPDKILGQIGTAIFALASIPFMFLLISHSNDVNASTEVLNRYVKFWSDHFVDAVFGEVAGQIAGVFLSPFRKRK